MITWAHGCIYGSYASAEKVYAEITSIGERVTPKDVVEFARNPNTELHKLIEFDDTKAAEKYRETQARQIIRCIVVSPDVESKGEEKPPIRAIVSTNQFTREYEPITVTIRNKDSYERLLEEALRELAAFKRKYASLKELEPVFEAADEIIA